MRDDRMNRQDHDSAQTGSRLRRRGKGGETKQKRDVGNSGDDRLRENGRDTGSPEDRWEGEGGIHSPEEEFGGESGGGSADTGISSAPGADSHVSDPAPASDPDSTDPSTPMEIYRIPPRKWFLTFMYMNIPLIGWIYLLVKAFGRKNTQLKDFARAYLLYKLLFLLVALIILGLAVYVGLGLLDEVLAYMEML